MTISDERLDELLAAANPLTDDAAMRLPLDHEFDELLEFVWAPRRRRRSTTAAAAVTAAAVLLTGGVAAAAWRSSHTGVVVNDGAIGTSEWLDTSGDDFAYLAREAGNGIPLPPGDDLDAYIRDALPHSGLISANGVRVLLSYDAQCAWEGYWLQAFDDGDGDAQAAATTVLQQIPTWPQLTAADAGGVIDQARTVATAANAEREGPIRHVWSANCTELPRRWAHS